MHLGILLKISFYKGSDVWDFVVAMHFSFIVRDLSNGNPSATACLVVVTQALTM